MLVVLRPALGGESDGHPEIPGLRHEIEPRRHDAEDPVRQPVHADVAPHDCRIAAEAPPPQVVAEDDDLLAPRLVLLGAEGAAEGRRDAEDVEKRPGDADAGHPRRCLPRREVEARELHRRDARKDVRALGEGDVISGREVGLDRARRGCRDVHQSLRPRHRQRAQHDRIDDAEDGGRGADSQGQRQHGDQGEAGMGGELAPREDYVLTKFTEVLAAEHVQSPFSGRSYGRWSQFIRDQRKEVAEKG